jgi:pyrimidine-nucleoside phosphorylase
LFSVEIGAGRRKKSDSIDMHAGIYLNKKTGEFVKENEVLCEVYSSNKVSNETLNSVKKEFLISENMIERPKLILQSF